MTPEEEEMNRWMTEEWANELYQSDNPHDLLVGAKIAAYAKTPRTDSRLPAWTSDYSADEFLSRALTLSPDDPLVLYTLTGYCLSESQSAVCQGNHTKSLASIDAGNGIVWMLYTQRAYERGDTATALQLLEYAARSERFDDYFGKQLVMYDSALREHRSLTEAQYVTAAMGMAAASMYPVSPTFNMCETEAVSSMKWRKACLGLGRLMEEGGPTELTHSLGTSLQVQMLELAGRLDEFNAARARQREDKERMDGIPRIDEAIPEDDPFWSEFFRTFVEDGEFAAWELAERVVSERAGAGHTD